MDDEQPLTHNDALDLYNNGDIEGFLETADILLDGGPDILDFWWSLQLMILICRHLNDPYERLDYYRRAYSEYHEWLHDHEANDREWLLECSDGLHDIRERLFNDFRHLGDEAYEALVADVHEQVPNDSHRPSLDGAPETLPNDVHIALGNGVREPLSNGVREPLSNGTHGPLSNGVHHPLSNGAHSPHWNGTFPPYSNGDQSSHSRSDGDGDVEMENGSAEPYMENGFAEPYMEETEEGSPRDELE